MLIRTGAIALMLLAARIGSAAPPTVRNLDVRGLQIGATTTLTFDGVDLPTDPRVLMSVPIAAQVLRPSASATRVELDVTLDGNIAPGFYNLYLAGDEGTSEKTVVALDRLPQRRFAPTVETLPIALHGALSGSTTLRTSFTAKAGQRLICEVESQRLAGKLRPVLHLYDAQERHIAWSLPAPTLRGDTRLIVTVPADGQYALTLNDLQFAGQAPGHFRLKIGEWDYADVAFPVTVERGSTASVRLLGSLPPDKLVALTAAGQSSALPAPWPAGIAASGPAPAIAFSDVPELIEQPPGDVLQEFPSIPAAIHGRLTAAGEEDRFRIKAPAETKLRCEIFAARLSATLDSVLEIRRPDGAVLTANDDTPGSTDSSLELTMPKDVDSLIIVVRDSLGRGGDAAIYRLLVTPADAPPIDFHLSVERDAYNVVQNSRQVVRLRVDRQGYQGPIGLSFGQLPWGVAIDSADIPTGMHGKLVTLTAGADAPQCRLTTICGSGSAAPRALARTASAGANPIGRDQPWLAAELPIALAARGGVGFEVDWQPPADAKLVLGGKFAAPVRCVRPAGFDGPVRLALLTSQNPPQVNGVDDPNRTLRPEPNAPVEIPSDAQAVAKWDAKLAADKVLAEAQTAQAAAAKAAADAQAAGGAALEAASKAKADADARVTDAAGKQAAADEAAHAAAAAAKNDVGYNIAVPADLTPGIVEIAFRAELLSRDRQSVLMTVCTPVRRIATFNPLRVQIGSDKLTTKLTPAGATVKLTGKIERLEGFAGDVTMTLVGLPAGVAAPRLVVPAAMGDFELELKFPATLPAGVLNGIQLVASGRMTPSSPIEVRSEPVAVAVELLPADAAK